MPSMCGIVRLKPKFTPDASNMVLFGPGVIEVTRANRAKPSSRSSESVMEGGVRQGRSGVDPIAPLARNPWTVTRNLERYSFASAWTTVKLYRSPGVHFTLVVEAIRLLRLAEQFGFFRMVLVEGQSATVQRLQRQFPGFFSRVRAKLRGNMAGTSGEYGDG